MRTLKQELVAAIFVEISKNNTDNEEDLNMYISEKLIEHRFDKRFKDNIQVLNVEVDNFKEVPNGAWVYSINSLGDWVFERYNSIGEAVQRAVNIVGAVVICNGKEIAFEAFDDEHAYYIDNNENVIMVTL